MGALGMSPARGAAAAAGSWTTPQPLSTGPAVGTPTLAFDARGWAFSTWANGSDRPPARWSASRTPSAAAFRHARPAPFIGEETVEAPPPAPVVDNSGTVITLQQRRIRGGCGLAEIYTLTPRFGRVNGSFAPAHGGWTIFSHTIPPAVALAGNGRGMAVAAWMQLQRDARGRCVNAELVRVAVRTPGGAFGAPVTLARAASSGAIAASVAQDGEILVAWRYGQRIETRSRSAAGAWRPMRSAATGPVDSFAATLGSAGSTYLIWTHTQATEAPQAARVVGAAVRGARSTRFATSTLERGTWPTTYSLGESPERFAVRLAVVRNGALAAWTSWAGDHMQVQTATATTRRFGAARLATPIGQDFVLGDLAASAAGRPALALTSNASITPSGPFVALGSTHGSFGAPEEVGPGSPRIQDEALAFSPSTGRPTLVWTQYNEALPPDVALASSRRKAE